MRLSYVSTLILLFSILFFVPAHFGCGRRDEAGALVPWGGPGAWGGAAREAAALSLQTAEKNVSSLSSSITISSCIFAMIAMRFCKICVTWLQTAAHDPFFRSGHGIWIAWGKQSIFPLPLSQLSLSKSAACQWRFLTSSRSDPGRHWACPYPRTGATISSIPGSVARGLWCPLRGACQAPRRSTTKSSTSTRVSPCTSQALRS